ncbi:MAG: SDR family NAD(P)-dependent oxidoreductase [Deinococcota bacterium]
MHNKTILITGGTSGIGRETAIGLAKLGARVIVTGRDPHRGERAIKIIQQESHNHNIHLLLADLSTQAEVRGLAEKFQASFDRLDVLINNLGLLEGQLGMTSEGVEADFAVNVVTPFLLTHLLLDSLKKSDFARVINVTGGMPGAQLDLDNLQAEKGFQALKHYTNTKVAMMAMSLTFAETLEGTDIVLNVCYPGGASTNMTRAMTPSYLPWFMRPFFPLFKLMARDDAGKSAAKAARSSIYLASSAKIAGVTGKYFNTNSKQMDWPKDILDPNAQRVVWHLCEDLTGMEHDSTFVPSKSNVSVARAI